MSLCTIRVSIGELFDKYTILEIKQERITDATKLEYLSREISMLDLTISNYPVSYNLIKTLKTTNAKLWDIEDKIRIKEREKCFDAEFIELARSVYITNDERCRIKNNISALFNDDIMDVKSYVDFAPAPASAPAPAPAPAQNEDIINLHVTDNISYSVEENNDTSNTKTEQKLPKVIVVDDEKMKSSSNNDNKTKSPTNSEIEALKKKLKNDPHNVTYIEKIAEISKQNEDYKTAIQYFTKLVYMQPWNGTATNELGICYFNTEEYDKAVDVFKQVLKIKNDIPDVYTNIGACYNAAKRHSSAISAYKIAYKMQPSDKVDNALGNAYFYSKDYDISIAHYKKITDEQFNPKYQISFVYMAQNDFKTGLPLYESRLNDGNPIHPQTKERTRLEVPFLNYWNGIDKCDRLLVIYEQGLGDNVQYYRFIIELAEKYPKMQITYFCRDVIGHIFKPYPNINTIVKLESTAYDYKLYSMSVPFILKYQKMTLNTINYIQIQDTKNKYWKDKLSGLKGYKVGFTYKGYLISFIDKNLPIEEFASLCDLDIDLICIHPKKEIQTNNIKIPSNLHIYDIDVDKPFEDTIAILNNVDLVISIDSVVAHLAGVMDVKTWLLLGYGSDWRWGKKNTQFWYKNVELIRLTEELPFKNIMPLVRQKLFEELKTKSKTIIRTP